MALGSFIGKCFVRIQWRWSSWHPLHEKIHRSTSGVRISPKVPRKHWGEQGGAFLLASRIYLSRGRKACCPSWGVILQFISVPKSINLQHSQKLLERQFGMILIPFLPCSYFPCTSAVLCFPFFLVLVVYAMVNNVKICKVTMHTLKKNLLLPEKSSRSCTLLLTVILVTPISNSLKKEGAPT